MNENPLIFSMEINSKKIVFLLISSMRKIVEYLSGNQQWNRFNDV